MVISLGMIENMGMIASIAAADSALKAADVKLVDIEFVRGGITTVMITGEVAAVKAGVDAAVAEVSKISEKPEVSIIPRLSDDATLMLLGNDAVAESDKQTEEKAIVVEEKNSARRTGNVTGITKRELCAYAESIGITKNELKGLRKSEIIAIINKHTGDER